MRSVFSQGRTDFEYIVVDGASSDNSVDVIRQYAAEFGTRLRWVSEPDKGIYNAMNKGIGMASGEYLQFLNSGDSLVSNDVVDQMLDALEKNGRPSILYGNLLKDISGGRVLRDRCFAGQDITLLGFYRGSLNHSSSYIQNDLFRKYGLYDESLKIVADWKWFLNAIVYGGEKPVYSDCDVALFDMNGISETNKDLDRNERKEVLSEMIPEAILSDYEKWSFSIEQMKRLERHPWIYKMVWALERVLFKIEKRRQKQISEIQFK